MEKQQVDPLIKRIQAWLQHIEPLLPAGRLESEWELVNDGEIGLAVESSVDRLEDCSRPLSEDEISELRTLLGLVKAEPGRIERNINWVRTLGGRSSQ